MTVTNFSELRALQNTHFFSGATRALENRIATLRKLRSVIKNSEAKIIEALRRDFGKPEFETYLTEIGFVYHEIDFVLKKLSCWMKPQRVSTPVVQWPAKSYIYHEPRGRILIIGPWNYPFQLIISPLVGALAAGNCVVLKPSELAPATSRLLFEMLNQNFSPHLLHVVEGGPDVTQKLLAEPYDSIFFTGGERVGRIVMEAAARTLTPVTLELGGKSPCLVDGSTPLDVTARRIVWGKFLNAGQTCIAPDYILVQSQAKHAFLAAMKAALAENFGSNAQHSSDYARIVNVRHFDRLVEFLKHGHVVAGGGFDRESRYIEPTLLDGVDLQSPIMQEEIFGPLLPILTFDAWDEAIHLIRQRSHPLSLYIFSTDQAAIDRILRDVSFGGGCVNDTLMHIGNPHLPFGGVGASGIGAYHGFHSFELFSHRKGVMKRALWPDLKIRYRPYAQHLSLVKKIFK